MSGRVSLSELLSDENDLEGRLGYEDFVDRVNKKCLKKSSKKKVFFRRVKKK